MDEAQSIEDRIADKIFPQDVAEREQEAKEPEEEVEEIEAQDEEVEDDESEEVEAKDDESDDDFVEIEIEGEVLQVPEKYKDYFLRQEDYTRKTQEVAQQRKEIETRIAEIDQRASDYQFIESVQDDLDKVKVLDWQISQYKDHLRNNLDQLDQSAVLQIQMQLEQLKEEKDGVSQAVQKKYQEHQQAREQSVQELLEKSTEVLKQKIPNWGADTQKAVRDYALNSGFTEQEINQVYDPRYVEVLWKAAQYDGLKRGSKDAVKKVQAAPKIKTKSRNPMPEDVKQKLNMRKKLKNPNVSNQDKAELIGDRIAERFGL